MTPTTSTVNTEINGETASACGPGNTEAKINKREVVTLTLTDQDCLVKEVWAFSSNEINRSYLSLSCFYRTKLQYTESASFSNEMFRCAQMFGDVLWGVGMKMWMIQKCNRCTDVFLLQPSQMWKKKLCEKWACHNVIRKYCLITKSFLTPFKSLIKYIYWILVNEFILPLKALVTRCPENISDII